MLRTRSPLGLPEQAPWTPFDLHVLSTPPAFVLSQDQTLQQKRVVTLGGRLEVGTIECRACRPCGIHERHDLDVLLDVTGTGMPATELTSRSSHGHPEVFALTSCPHWHSVFSSVFKEP